jgi:predicted GNAT family N-acyltransferase
MLHNARNYLCLQVCSNTSMSHSAESKPPNKTFQIREVSWLDASIALSSIRTEVFINEQHVPPALEWDDLDADAKHLIALNSAGDIIACARILAPGTIGRMAVKNNFRGIGIGRALLDAAIAVCKREGWRNIQLSAQIHATGFYEKAGFVVVSDVYLDAGIPHHDMRVRSASE